MTDSKRSKPRLWQQIVAQAEVTKLLNDLATVPERGVEWFWQERGDRADYPHLSDAKVREVAEQLLEVWNPDTSPARRTAIQREWLKVSKPSLDPDWQPSGEQRLVGEVWVALIALGGRVRRCANNECNRLFIPGRETQKFCGRAECAVWARRFYARQHWHTAKAAAVGELAPSRNR